jgi:pimeloyl-ACP methyl ester carboxylesterase
LAKLGILRGVQRESGYNADSELAHTMKKRIALASTILMVIGFAVPTSAEVIVTLRALRATPGVDCLNQPCPSRHAIVFIHGVFGSDGTWGSGASSWPNLLAQDHRFDGYDLYLAGYPTSEFFWSPGNKIRLTQVAEDFSRRLENLTHYKSIHIIAHSMGGNIVTTSMIMLKLRRQDAHQILSNVTTILLGSPIDGADIAKLGRLLSQDQKLIALKPAAENELPVLVEMGMKAINEKREFMDLRPLALWAGYEMDPVGVDTIVTRESATKIAELSRTCGFHKNHITLVKPASMDDPVYQWTAKIILTEPPVNWCPAL